MYLTFNFQNKTMSTGLKETRTGGEGGREGRPYICHLKPGLEKYTLVD